MKQFIKSLPKERECFRYLYSKFPTLTEAKLKEGVFIAPAYEKYLSKIIGGKSKKKHVTLIKM